MEVALYVPEGTDVSLVEKEYPDLYEDEGYGDGLQSYWCGKSMEEEDTECGEWMTYDECVEFCGFCEGAIDGAETLMEGNGGWAQGMLSEKDFSRFAVDDACKASWKKRSDIYWKAHRRGARLAKKLKSTPTTGAE